MGGEGGVWGRFGGGGWWWTHPPPSHQAPHEKELSNLWHNLDKPHMKRTQTASMNPDRLHAIGSCELKPQRYQACGAPGGPACPPIPARQVSKFGLGVKDCHSS